MCIRDSHWAGTPFEWGCTVYLAGSDALGRDLWSRVIYGSRVSLSVAIVASMVSLVIGIFMGVLSGYAGGWVDNLIMRVVDFLYAVPLLPLIILVSVYFKALGNSGEQPGKMCIRDSPNTGGYYSSVVAPIILGCADVLNAEDPSAVPQELIDAIGVTAPDAGTLVIQLENPTSFFLSMTPMWVLNATPQ